MALAAADIPWIKSYPPEVDWAAALPVKPLHCLLDDAAAAHPENDCVDFQDKRYSYAEINAEANRVAHRLIAEGIGPEHATSSTPTDETRTRMKKLPKHRAARPGNRRG